MQNPSNPAWARLSGEFLREQLAPLGHIALRRMFGKIGVFCDGLMLGMVTDNTLYFRVDEDNRADFREAASSPPLNYRKKASWPIFRSGARPGGCSTSPDELVEWGRIALAAARRVAANEQCRRADAKLKPQPAGQSP
jgi:DNA transformation protein